MDPTASDVRRLKVSYVLTDLSEPGRGKTKVIPGSHLNNTLSGRPEKPGDQITEPEGAVEVLLNPGDAFIFDRRLWHSRSTNQSNVTRKMLFIGYTYRWIRPLDEPSPTSPPSGSRASPRCSSQLLGDGTRHAPILGHQASGWIDDEIPLRAELKERGLLDRDVPLLR